MKKKEYGYTLIELIVAIAIIAILASIAVLNYQGFKYKAQAAQISSHLHVIEDGIISAIIDGKTVDDFGGQGNINLSNFGSSVLKPYLTSADFTGVPKGISISIGTVRTADPGHFMVMVIVRGEKGTEKILNDLEKMFPKTTSHSGNMEFIVVDSNTLKLKPK